MRRGSWLNPGKSLRGEPKSNSTIHPGAFEGPARGSEASPREEPGSLLARGAPAAGPAQDLMNPEPPDGERDGREEGQQPEGMDERNGKEEEPTTIPPARIRALWPKRSRKERRTAAAEPGVGPAPLRARISIGTVECSMSWVESATSPPALPGCGRARS